MRSLPLVLLTAAMMGLSSAARAECHLSKYLELPVTMRGARPIVSAELNGRSAQFILDSGAFYSILSPASARTYGLPLSPLPLNFVLRGINGETSGSVTTVRTFGIGAVSIPDVTFVVGGTDTGQAGLIGQNLLGIGDVEYDFRHGVVRLLRAKGCKVEDLAYWASDTPVTIIPIEQRSPRQPHTIATVILNGVKLRAVFDTGAPDSILTMSAARKAGVTPNSPGVVGGGLTIGLGSRALRTWTGTFSRLQIGGESIPNPRIRFSDAQLVDADMLIGADFFLTHHIYVANAASRMLITYEGGPVFGISPMAAVDGEGKPIDLTDRAAEPTDAEGFARRGAALASRGNLDAAIADFSRAIALDPKQARFLRQRAAARLASHQLRPLAAADLDQALALDPADVEARFMRARLRLAARDATGAAEDVRALDKELSPSAGERLELAAIADSLGMLDLALVNQDAWLKAHSDDARRAMALNGRCSVLAQLNRDLSSALNDCNAALRARPNTASFLASRALVRLRQGNLAGALADYDGALATQPGNAWALYMRSVVKRRAGDVSGAEKDRQAALAVAPRIADRAAKLGFAN